MKLIWAKHLGLHRLLTREAFRFIRHSVQIHRAYRDITLISPSSCIVMGQGDDDERDDRDARQDRQIAFIPRA